jgi:hypothetical protein
LNLRLKAPGFQPLKLNRDILVSKIWFQMGQPYDTDRTIILTPPEGEFSLMNYRSANDFNPPFKVTTVIDETSPFKVGVTLKIKADFPAKHTCTGMVVKFPVPKVGGLLELECS